MNAISEKPSAADSQAQSLASIPVPATPPRSRRSLKNGLRLGGLALVLIGGAVTANWWFSEGRYIESTDNAYVQGDIAVLGPRVAGDVLTIPVTDNQAVKAGDPLIVLDPRDWQAKLDQARAAAAEAAAAVTTAQRQIDQSHAAVTQSDALIAQAQAEATRATAQAGRSQSLVGAGWTSRQANDQAVADAGKASAALAAAQAQKATYRQGEAVAAAQAVQAEARRQSAEATMRLAEANLADTIIRAPFDGTVGNRAAQLGQHVQPGLQLISVTPPADKLYVIANFKETQLRHMRPGQQVELSPDIDSGHEIYGEVQSLAPATGALFSLLPPENATGNFTKVVQRVPVKIALDAGQARQAGWLRAGLSVTADVDTRGGAAHWLGLFGAAASTLHMR